MTDVAGSLVPGSSLGAVLVQYAGRALRNSFRPKAASQHQDAINALTGVSFDRAREIAGAAVSKTALDEVQRGDLVNYLSAIPMTARKAISRPGDGGNPTTLLSQLPRAETDMERFVPRHPPRCRPGMTIQGHDYELKTLLGIGGFGEVWRAQHTVSETRPPVALKFCFDPKLRISLKTEIKLLDKLNDPSYEKDFVKLLHTAYDAEPPFLVYEYIDGGDLQAWLTEFDGKRPKPHNVITILKIVARAVDIAHRHGIVHRDLKPGNLLVTREGRVKVADFGIGSLMAGAEERSVTPITNATILREAHTALYRDREQALGDGSIDPRVDVYALGVIGYQLLVGDLAGPIGPDWNGELEEIGTPPDLIQVIGRCVAVRSKRFADAGALLAGLEDIKIGKKKKRKKSTTSTEAGHGGAESKAASRPTKKKSSQTKRKYCTHCGTRIQRSNRFCTECGHPF